MSPAGRPSRRRGRRGEPPLEYRLLLTVALVLFTFGVVMVFSASSAPSILGGEGDGLYYLKRTLLVGAVGLLMLRVLSSHGVAIVSRITPLLVGGSIILLVAVLLPGVGYEVNGARRWIEVGFVQVQPSEIAKLSVILLGAMLFARRPERVGSLRELANPYLGIVALICLLIVVEPDLGTAIVVMFAVAAMLVAAGTPLRVIAALAAVLVLAGAVAVVVEPYRTERIATFLNPGDDVTGAGFQSSQARIALGSGGLFGVGPGASVQKAFYLPEAHTDMIFAVIGEEWGLLGVMLVVALFAILGYAGFTVARNARDRYSQLLCAGLTCLILCQALLNFFAVLGLAPLTGVPLPLVSYGNSSLLVTMAAIGLMLDVARRGSVPAVRQERSSRRRAARAGRLRVLEGGRGSRSAGRRSTGKETRGQRRDRSRGDRGARGPRPRGRRRLAG